MALVVSFRKAHDAFSTTVSWPNPAAYSLHCKHRVGPGH